VGGGANGFGLAEAGKTLSHLTEACTERMAAAGLAA
jgi:hypothetical protein